MTKTVLIVDDDEDVREIAQLSIELGAGWNVIAASSGLAGVSLAAAEQPDAILLDVMMPGLDGPATLDRLQSIAETRSIPVIFLTAKARASDQVRLAALGVAGVLPKPFDPVALPGQISDLLGWSD
ncbi:MAG: response regulator [Gemmatimonadaceae bacterium]